MFNITDDNKLFTAIKNNSEIAFKTLYEKFFAKIIQYILRMCRDYNLAEEISQITLIKFWELRSQIILKTSLRSYLYKMSYNEYLMYLRNKSKFPNIENAVIEAIDEITDDDQNQIVLDKVRQQIDKLPPKCREVFILSKVEGLKYKEIAEKLDISTKTIEAHMTKALKMIREAF